MFFEPAARGDDMQLFIVQDRLFQLKGAVREIMGSGLCQLGTILTASPIQIALVRVMATTGKRIHVVQCPDDWKVVWDGSKKRLPIDHLGNPMQMNDIAGHGREVQPRGGSDRGGRK